MSRRFLSKILPALVIMVSASTMLVANDAEQALIARMKAMRDDGASFGLIADQLNAEGAPTKRGGRWAGMTVKKILDRAA